MTIRVLHCWSTSKKPPEVLHGHFRSAQMTSVDHSIVMVSTLPRRDNVIFDGFLVVWFGLEIMFRMMSFKCNGDFRLIK